jgi:hypothetical protein
MLGCPQLAMAVEMSDVQAPNLGTVEAQREAKWPPQGQATEQRRGPGQLPREVLYERDPVDLKITGTCKPGHLEGWSWDDMAMKLKAGEDR